MTPWRPHECALSDAELRTAWIEGLRDVGVVTTSISAHRPLSQLVLRADAELLRLPGLFQSWLKAQRARS